MVMQRVEQQLENTQKRFTVLFHHMNDAAVLADVETGLILEANQPAELLWGRSISDLVGSHQSSLHPPIISDEAKQAFENHIAALQKNKRDSIQLPILRPDGTEVPAEISSSLIEIDGKVTILGVFRDISERIKAEQDLRERDAHLQLSSHLESIGTLAAGVAHEINNPLTYVLGNLETIRELLQERGVVDPEIISAIDTATTGGGYVREIVSDLKAMSRMDDTDETCDPAAVVRVASRMAMSDLRHRARLDINLADTPDVKVASARLSQVMLNVLSNASRAFSVSDMQKNQISIQLFEQGDKVQIEVQDNGSGIAPEDLKHVWEPFFTRSEGKGGTGLGLAICRRILTEVGGTLDLESELGKGTKVIISIPKASAQDGLDAKPDSNNEIILKRKPKVLVVDDDALVTTIIDRMLRNDFDLTIHNNPLEALEVLQGEAEFDVVLCDIMMPEMDGRAFYQTAQSDIPFVFLTGGAVTQENIEFEHAMAQQGRLIYKPFEANRLRNLLKSKVAFAEEEVREGIVAQAEEREPTQQKVAELEELLGHDMLQQQYQALLGDLQSFMENAASMAPLDLAKAAHRNAGACGLLGLPHIDQAMRSCQLLATNEEKEGAIAALQPVPERIQHLAEFLAA